MSLVLSSCFLQVLCQRASAPGVCETTCGCVVLRSRDSTRQRVPTSGSTADRCAYAQRADPVGQSIRKSTRDAWHG